MNRKRPERSREGPADAPGLPGFLGLPAVQCTENSLASASEFYNAYCALSAKRSGVLIQPSHVDGTGCLLVDTAVCAKQQVTPGVCEPHSPSAAKDTTPAIRAHSVIIPVGKSSTSLTMQHLGTMCSLSAGHASSTIAVVDHDGSVSMFRLFTGVQPPSTS